MRKILKCPIFRTFITFRWFWDIIDVSKEHGLLHLVNLGCIVVIVVCWVNMHTAVKTEVPMGPTDWMFWLQW